ncbi:uncharacterized protein LOC122850413 [Aphidius gifuensis]|uniref:uncharacterized protein LOC122850413 n=1 Tax=Aphidius gifuensis TaxID=684658 RepID=UPI001CDB4EF9|nr:uncharacterized protein LOC122850413 [Aphidius gifuensis]
MKMNELEKFPDQYQFSNEQVSSPSVFIIVQYGNEKKWVQLSEHFIYADIIHKVYEIYALPDEQEIEITDLNDVLIDKDILCNFIRSSGHNLTIKLRQKIVNLLDISKNIVANVIQTHGLKHADGSTSADVIPVPSDEAIDVNDDEEPLPKKPKLIKKITGDVVSSEQLKELLVNHSYGDEIFESYSDLGYLTKKCRKVVVNIVASELLKHKKITQRNLWNEKKVQCAKAIIEVFPKLGSLDSGYKQFYDPETRCGFISDALGNSSRRFQKRKTAVPQHEINNNIVQERVDESEVVNDAIEFMQTATKDQKELIIEKIKLTFKLRRYKYLDERFLEVFPRFLDIPDLINVEFNLLYPSIEQDIFLSLYPEYINAILHVFANEKINSILLDWDRVSNSLIALVALIPPTVHGKKLASRDKLVNIVTKLIFFQKSGTPLQSPLNQGRSQPKLIAIGPSKRAIHQYYIEIDNKFILLQTINVVEAISYLFKAHYVFHVDFHSDLKNFWTFLQNYFFKIKSNCTTSANETFNETKRIDNILENDFDSNSGKESSSSKHNKRDITDIKIQTKNDKFLDFVQIPLLDDLVSASDSNERSKLSNKFKFALGNIMTSYDRNKIFQRHIVEPVKKTHGIRIDKKFDKDTNTYVEVPVTNRLTVLIKDHHSLIINEFNSSLIMKDHLITHLPMIINKMGPPRIHWTMRYENMTFEKFKTMCLKCWKDNYGFIVIDKDSEINAGRYRKNFDTFISIDA